MSKRRKCSECGKRRVITLGDADDVEFRLCAPCAEEYYHDCAVEDASIARAEDAAAMYREACCDARAEGMRSPR